MLILITHCLCFIASKQVAKAMVSSLAIAESPIGKFNIEIGKFNIEVQSVDRCNLNNLYLKTPRDQGREAPINDFAWQKRLANKKWQVSTSALAYHFFCFRVATVSRCLPVRGHRPTPPTVTSVSSCRRRERDSRWCNGVHGSPSAL